jgi:hypothetical protein
MVLASGFYRSVDPYTPLAENTLRTSHTKSNERNGWQDLREGTVKGRQWEALFHSTESFMFSSWKMTG